MDQLSRHGREALDALRDAESPTDTGLAQGIARLEAELGAGMAQPMNKAEGLASVGAKLAVGTLVAAALVVGWLASRPAPYDPTSSPSPDPEPIAAVPDPPPSPPATPLPAAAPPVEPSPQVEIPKESTRKRRPDDEGSNLEAELRLVRGAGTASGKGDHREAMDLLAEHKRRFPRGVLAGERELTRAKTLCAMGKRDSARKLAERYLARHAKSHLASRFEQVCR